jgi:hypothetical protein
MSKAIPVTRSELERAWRDLRRAANVSPRQPPHLLLVFYAVECGLKAVWLKNEAKNIFGAEEIKRLGHKLDDLIREANKGLVLGQHLALPNQIRFAPLQQSTQRNGTAEQLHQAWRYGVPLVSPDVVAIEATLNNLMVWINAELTRS